MSRPIPLCDIIAKQLTSKLSIETKMKLYQDLQSSYPDKSSDVMENDSIEDALDEFAFHVFWAVQHQLLSAMDMKDDEMEQRIY